MRLASRRPRPPSHKPSHEEPSFNPSLIQIQRQIESGDVEGLSELLRQAHFDVNRDFDFTFSWLHSGGSFVCTMLHWACRKGALDIVRTLVTDFNADPNAVNYEIETPLMFAAWNNRLEIVKFLVDEANADIDTKNTMGRTARDIAYLRNKENIFRFLSDKEGRPRAETERELNDFDPAGRNSLVSPRESIEKEQRFGGLSYSTGNLAGLANPKRRRALPPPNGMTSPKSPRPPPRMVNYGSVPNRRATTVTSPRRETERKLPEIDEKACQSPERRHKRSLSDPPSPTGMNKYASNPFQQTTHLSNPRSPSNRPHPKVPSRHRKTRSKSPMASPRSVNKSTRRTRTPPRSGPRPSPKRATEPPPYPTDFEPGTIFVRRRKFQSLANAAALLPRYHSAKPPVIHHEEEVPTSPGLSRSKSEKAPSVRRFTASAPVRSPPPPPPQIGMPQISAPRGVAPPAPPRIQSPPVDQPSSRNLRSRISSFRRTLTSDLKGDDIVYQSINRGPRCSDGSTILEGTIAFVPTPTQPGWIASTVGMFRIDPSYLNESFMTEGQSCTFVCDNVDSIARDIQVASAIPEGRVATFYDENGHTKWDAPFYVMQTYLESRGTLTHNEFLAFDRLDVYDSAFQDLLEETMNAFINTEGGTIYIGVRKGENLISGCLLTRDEQVEIQRIVWTISTELWKPEIPQKDSRMSVSFVPICLTDGEICRDFFVVRIMVQGPIYDSGGKKMLFSYKRNNLAFTRQLSWNVAVWKK